MAVRNCRKGLGRDEKCRSMDLTITFLKYLVVWRVTIFSLEYEKYEINYGTLSSLPPYTSSCLTLDPTSCATLIVVLVFHTLLKPLLSGGTNGTGKLIFKSTWSQWQVTFEMLKKIIILMVVRILLEHIENCKVHDD